MKRKYSTILMVCLAMMVLFLTPSHAHAQENEAEIITSGDYQYTQDAQTNEINIVAYIGTDEKVVVPAYLDGKKVKKVSFSNYFERENNVTKEVVVSEGIEIIDFSGCMKLEKISIPNSVVELSEEAFNYCKKLQKIDIPDSVVKIGKDAFWRCKSLKEVRLPAGLKVIENGTFAFCENLTNIKIPYGVEKIRSGAFSNCYALKEIVIPDSVTWLGTEAFFCCKNLSQVKLSKNITVIRRATFSCSNIKSIEIPKKVTRIESNAFASSKLTKIVIPSKVKYIGLSAFHSSRKLKSITFKGSKLPEINKRAFYDLHAKVTFDVPNKSKSKYKKLLSNKKVYDGKKLKIK